MVGADGRVRTASADSNPDLYWAIRGGGGNFGIVTSFTFQLHELGPDVAFAATIYPLEDAAQIWRGWRDYVTGAPDEVTSSCVSITFPASPDLPPPVHDRACLVVGGVYAGDVEKGLCVMAPLRQLGTPVFDMSGPTPYVGVQSGFDALFPRNALRAYWRSQYVDELTDEAIDTVARIAQLAARAAHAHQPVPHGRCAGGRGSGGHGLRHEDGAVHGLDRRDVDRSRRRRGQHRVGQVGVGGRLPARDR